MNRKAGLPPSRLTFHVLRLYAFATSYAIVKEQHQTKSMRSRSKLGGGERVRTDDPLRARQVLSQLSYTPKFRRAGMVGLAGLEPATSRLSVVCSSQLSYKPIRHR